MTATLNKGNNDAIKGSAYTFDIGLFDSSSILVSSPTIATGDFKISKDGGTPANLASDPTSDGTLVLVALSSGEMTCDRCSIHWLDAAGDEWISSVMNISTKTAVTVSSYDEASDTVILTDDGITAAKLAASATAEIAAADWAYATRTLTQYGVTSASASAAAITQYRGDSWSIALDTLGTLTSYTSIWFTIKTSKGDIDTASIIQIKLNESEDDDGLLFVNGVAATAAQTDLGSITVTDAAAGDITIALDEIITDDLVGGVYSYDVQALISGAVSTMAIGKFTVSEDVTRSVT